MEYKQTISKYKMLGYSVIQDNSKRFNVVYRQPLSDETILRFVTPSNKIREIHVGEAVILGVQFAGDTPMLIIETMEKKSSNSSSKQVQLNITSLVRHVIRHDIPTPLILLKNKEISIDNVIALQNVLIYKVNTNMGMKFKTMVIKDDAWEEKPDFLGEGVKKVTKLHHLFLVEYDDATRCFSQKGRLIKTVGVNILETIRNPMRSGKIVSDHGTLYRINQIDSDGEPVAQDQLDLSYLCVGDYVHPRYLKELRIPYINVPLITVEADGYKVELNGKYHVISVEKTIKTKLRDTIKKTVLDKRGVT